MPKLAELSLEQCKANLEKAHAARAANAAARAASTLRRDFMDATYWEDLARAKGLRLPPWGQGCSVSTMRSFLHKAGLSQSKYEGHYGKLQGFPQKNPTWPLRSWAGTVLELLEGREKAE